MNNLYNLVRFGEHFSNFSQNIHKQLNFMSRAMPGCSSWDYISVRFQGVVKLVNTLINFLQVFQKYDFIAALVQLIE